MSNKEYLARRAIAGTMPHLNRVFKELGIHHEEHKVPSKVLKSLEDKARKAATKNTTTVAEAKKRKGSGRTKTFTKRLKIGAFAGATSAGSGEEVVESVHDSSALAMTSAEAKQSATSAAHEGGNFVDTAL